MNVHLGAAWAVLQERYGRTLYLPLFSSPRSHGTQRGHGLSTASACRVAAMNELTQQDKQIAGAAILLTAVGLPFAYVSEDDPDTGGLIIVAVIALAAFAAVFLWLVPRERAAGDAARLSRTTLILGIVAFLFIAVFWLGLPLAVGAGAIAVGLSSAAPGTARSGAATAGIALGAFAVLASFVLLLFG
jgi:hypothetical protein